MIIYADILFLLNAFITYITLLLTAIILKTPAKRRRILIASLVGGGYAISILIQIPIYISIPLKVLICALITFISFGRLNLRLFLIHALVFLAINVFIGGIVLLLSFADNHHFYSNIAISYINVTPLTLIIALSVSFITVCLLNRILSKKRHREEIYKVVFTFEEKEYILFGFCDSGNHLSEPFSAMPVCVIKKGIVKGFREYPLKRIIPYSSLGGEGMMEAVKLSLHIETTAKSGFDTYAYIAESTQAFRDMQYDIILHPRLFSEMESL